MGAPALTWLPAGYLATWQRLPAGSTFLMAWPAGNMLWPRMRTSMGGIFFCRVANFNALGIIENGPSQPHATRK